MRWRRRTNAVLPCHCSVLCRLSLSRQTSSAFVPRTDKASLLPASSRCSPVGRKPVGLPKSATANGNNSGNNQGGLLSRLDYLVSNANSQLQMLHGLRIIVGGVPAASRRNCQEDYFSFNSGWDRELILSRGGGWDGASGSGKRHARECVRTCAVHISYLRIRKRKRAKKQAQRKENGQKDSKNALCSFLRVQSYNKFLTYANFS